MVLMVAAAALAALGTRAPARADADHQRPSAPPRVLLIDVDGSINPAVTDFIENSIRRAEAEDASALVIRLDTPGGLLSSAQKIVKALLNASVPVIVYVAPQGAFAASAGTFITEAANVAAMAPGTTIGAAHPIEPGGGELPSGKVEEKIENFTAAFAKSIARQRGRNVQWAEEAVRKSTSIDENEALKLHVIDLVADNLDDLLRQASGRKVTLPSGRVVTLALADAAISGERMTLGQSVLNRLADPNIMYMLMIAGVIGLYFEFSHPGVFLPGVAGAICLLIALASFQLIPINLAGLLLVVLGIVLLVAELFVTSYGVLGIGGVISFVIGSLFLVDTSQTNATISRGLIAGVTIGLTAVILGIGYIALRARREPALTGGEGMVGLVGEVRAAIAPGRPGQIFVHGEIWRARSDESIGVGGRARIVAVLGLEVVVTPVDAVAGKATL